MLPCRLANKLPAKTEDRTQTAECEPPVLLEAAIYSRHTALPTMRAFLVNFSIKLRKNNQKPTISSKTGTGTLGTAVSGRFSPQFP